MLESKASALGTLSSPIRNVGVQSFSFRDVIFANNDSNIPKAKALDSNIPKAKALDSNIPKAKALDSKKCF